MKRSKWLIIGFILAVAIGFLLFKLWNLIVGAFAAVVLFVAFAVAAGSGFGWGSDDGDEDEDDEDDDNEDD
jgi:hypothetical protein